MGRPAQTGNVHCGSDTQRRKYGTTITSARPLCPMSSLLKLDGEALTDPPMRCQAARTVKFLSLGRRRVQVRYLRTAQRELGIMSIEPKLYVQGTKPATLQAGKWCGGKTMQAAIVTRVLRRQRIRSFDCLQLLHTVLPQKAKPG